MSRTVFSLLAGLILFAGSVASVGSARAQSQTPGTIVKWADDLSLTDSVITEDPATGNVGIGTTNPSQRLEVNGRLAVNGPIQARGGGDVTIAFNLNNKLSLGDRTYVLGNGNVGIGTASPVGNLDVSVNADDAIFSLSSIGAQRYQLSSRTSGRLEIARQGVVDISITPSDNVGIGTATPTAKLEVAGMTKTSALQITGGADFSEKFEVAPSESKIEPGMVVAIDPHHPGKLVVSERAYNSRVAGVISGAGGVQPGMLMGQSGTLADGDQPVALTGRVYVWADASNAPIAPGDLLTTSNLAGHAMKITDHRKSRGAIIGKAMTELRQGRGLVLTLVSLQ